MVNGVLAKLDDLKLSISYTTRPMRPKETNGKEYNFVSPEQFTQMISGNSLLEHAEVFDNYYGTSRQQVEDSLKQGLDVILEIDWQGAKQIKENFPTAILIFLLPPSLATLAERLNKRAADSPDVIKRRLQQAEEEISQHGLFDYLVVNDNFEHALSKLVTIIESFRLSRSYQEVKLDKLLKELLKN